MGAFGGQGWLMANGIDIAVLRETVETNPNAQLPITILDEAFPDTPVLILDNLGHGAVVNSEALRRVGLINGISPPGGEILKDGSTLYGIVTENTQQLFRDAAFPPTPENKEVAYQSLLDALDMLRRSGVTSVSDAGGFWRQAQTESWGRALTEDELTVRAR